MFDQSFLDDVINRSDIVEVVSRRVELKKAGKDYQALCPFHSEKSPSFTVSVSKQFYHCFGCGAHGNVLSFLVESDGMNFVDAVETLAKEAGMRLPEKASLSQEDRAKQNRVTQILDCLKVAKSLFLSNLNGHPEAVSYMKGRGLVRETVLSFGIGYADGTLMSKMANFPRGILIQAGLLVVNEETGEVYDKFRSRMMFPICSEKGDIIGFGGRVINDDAKPKYLNSPETPVFSKGRELFGLNLARNAIRQSRVAVLIEGFMDVSMLRQYGEERAVAALGTSLTEEQIKRLYRMCDEVVFCFDGDSAGVKAAARAVKLVLAAIPDGKSAKFLALPAAHDPDSFVRANGINAWRDAIELDAIPLSAKVTEVLIVGRDLALPEFKALLVKEAEALCGTIANAPRFREALISHLEHVLGMRIRIKKTRPANEAALAPAAAPTYQSINASAPHYEVYRRLATVCAMSSDDGADIAAGGIDVFADLIVSWFSTANAEINSIKEKAQAINDVTLRGFVVAALKKFDGRWSVLDIAARRKEQDAARVGLIAEIARLQRVRETVAFFG